MQPVTRPNWVWEKTDVRHSGSSGDIAKLFKNEGVAHPGVMATNAPSDEATLAAREVIQNSWDAARELQTELGAQGIDAPPFEIDFMFKDHLGSSKKKLSTSLDLAGLATQLKKVSSLGTSADQHRIHQEGRRFWRFLRLRKGGTRRRICNANCRCLHLFSRTRR